MDAILVVIIMASVPIYLLVRFMRKENLKSGSDKKKLEATKRQRSKILVMGLMVARYPQV